MAVGETVELVFPVFGFPLVLGDGCDGEPQVFRIAKNVLDQAAAVGPRTIGVHLIIEQAAKQKPISELLRAWLSL
jgi:hypothetical protein